MTNLNTRNSDNFKYSEQLTGATAGAGHEAEAAGAGASSPDVSHRRKWGEGAGVGPSRGISHRSGEKGEGEEEERRDVSSQITISKVRFARERARGTSPDSGRKRVWLWMISTLWAWMISILCVWMIATLCAWMIASLCAWMIATLWAWMIVYCPLCTAPSPVCTAMCVLPCRRYPWWIVRVGSAGSLGEGFRRDR